MIYVQTTNASLLLTNLLQYCMFVLQSNDLVGCSFFSGRSWTDCVRKTEQFVLLMSSSFGRFPFSRRHRKHAIKTVLLNERKICHTVTGENDD